MFYIIWKVSSYNKSIQQFRKTINCVKDTVSSKDCWTVLVSSRADKTSCKFDIQHWKIKNEEAVNAARLTEKRTADSAKRFWDKFTHNFLINFEKKLLLPGTQIIIAIMFNEQLPSFSVLFTSVLSSVYHLNSMISASFFVLPFKTSLISTFNQFLHLL